MLAVVLIGGFTMVSFATSGAAATPVANAVSSGVSTILDDGGEVGTGDSTGSATRTADAAEHALTPASDAKAVATGDSVQATTGTADAAEHRLTPVAATAAPLAPTGTADSLEHQLVDEFVRLPKPDADR
jgi:hypothetical protein